MVLSLLLVTSFFLLHICAALLPELLVELEGTQIFSEIDGERREISLIQYLCYISLDLHETVYFNITLTVSNIFYYKLHYSDFQAAPIWKQPLMIVASTTCNLMNSLIYNLFYIPNQLYNLAMREFLDRLII